jgi:uncharacterized protein
MTPPTSQRGSATVAGIPIRWVTRNHATGDAARRVALWLPYLGGTKDDVVPMLERLADAGFFAVSFDPSQHGERSSEPTAQLQDRMIGAFRREMWPVIGQSTLDAMWVLDWSLTSTTCRPVMRSPADSRWAATSASRSQGSTTA